ncbi:MAG: hypothetical protein IK107_02165 [Oscillospiraceae bacterium]|nr:hypothetical protein [Oscillospiraceae bacterium]
MTNRIYAEEAGGESAVRAGTGVGDFFRTVRDALNSKMSRAVIFLLQFVGSFLTIFYLRGVLRLAYYSLFYRLEIPAEQRKHYCVLISLALLGWGLLMLFTRRQIITRIVIMLAMPLYFPIFLFNYKHLVLIVPLAVMAAITYLASGTGEGPKTILGAVFLTIYVLGAFVFLSGQSVLKPQITEYTVERGSSQTGNYRYATVVVDDRAEGHTYIELEPNTLDIQYDNSVWRAKGYGKTVYLARPRRKFDAVWSVKPRAEITRELLLINPSVTFDLNAAQIKTLGLDKNYTKEYKLTSLSSKQRMKLKKVLKKDLKDSTAEELGVEVMKDDAKVTLTFGQMIELGLKPVLEQRLANLSDENLAALGVPEQNDVLTINGKVVFRQYVAVLERTFEKSNRSMTAFLESNDPAPITDLDLALAAKSREEPHGLRNNDESSKSGS